MPLTDLPTAERPCEKMQALGPGALSDVELLALLLRTGCVGKNVLQLASELLQLPSASAHGLAGLLQAGPEELARVKGLGPAKLAKLQAVLELSRRALAQPLRQRSVLHSPQALRDYLQLLLGGRSHEVFAVLFLDVKLRLIALEEMFRGSLSQTRVYPREVVQRALQRQASAVVLAHNHPSGSVQASAADRDITQTLRAALALVEVRVIDHIIVCPGAAMSMAEEGLL